MANDYPEEPRGSLADYFAQLFQPPPSTELQPAQAAPSNSPVYGGLDAFASVQDPRVFSNPNMYGAPNVGTALAQNAGMRALLGMPLAGGQLEASAKLPYLAAPSPEPGQRPYPRLDPRFELRWSRRF
jgi:hypothetical protein